MGKQAVLHVVAASLAPVFDGADLSNAQFDVAVDTVEQRGLLNPACGFIRLGGAVRVYFDSIESAMAYAAGLLVVYREATAPADDDFDGLVRTKFRPMRLVVDSGHSSVVETATPRVGVRVTGPLGERPNAYLEVVPDNLLTVSHHAQQHVDSLMLVRPAGEVRLGQFQGPVQMFHVPLEGDPELPASGSVAPMIRNLHFFRDTEEMLSFVGRESERRKRTGKLVKDVRYMSFNGGATLNDYLKAVCHGLGEDYSIRILLWDHQCSNLPADEGTRKLLDQIRGFDRQLRSERDYQAAFPNSDFTEVVCEYLLLASKVLSAPGPHAGDVYLRIPGICRDFHAKNPHGRISVAVSPCWVPGRINIVEDLAFFSLYLHRQKVGPIIMSPRHSPLFEPLNNHFQSVWSGTTREVYDSGNQISAPDHAGTPKIFVSYARDDGAFARLVRDKLVRRFDHVYFDVESNVLGENFVTRMLAEIGRSNVVVMVAGSGALSKLLDEKSYFRKEVEEALGLNKLLIPVYHGINGLTKDELPGSLHELAQRHAIMVDKGTTGLDSRLEELIHQIGRQR